MKHRDISVIIPTAGADRRTKPQCNRSLVRLPTNETVIGMQIRIIRSIIPRADIVVVVGYDADRVIKVLPSNVKVVENELFTNTNVARSIGMGLRVVNHNNVLVIYNDLIFNGPTISWILNKGSSVLIDSRNKIHKDKVGVNVIDGKVNHFSYGLPIKWGQIMYLTGRELEIFKSLVWNKDKYKYFGFEILNNVIEFGGTIRAVEPLRMKIDEVVT